MLRQLQEFSAHFRGNPLSWLVALLLALLLLLTLYFLYHMNLSMPRTALVHDQHQHLRLMEQALSQRLASVLRDVRMLTDGEGQPTSGAELREQLAHRCSRDRALLGFALRLPGAGRLAEDSVFKVVCRDNWEMPSLALKPGPPVQPMNKGRHRLGESPLVFTWSQAPRDAQQGGVWKVYYSLQPLMNQLHPHHDAPAVTQLLSAPATWPEGFTDSAVRRLKAGEAYWHDGSLWLARELVVRDPSDGSALGRWWLLTRVLPQVDRSFWLALGLDLALVGGLFGLMLVALYFYSRRVIGDQLRILSDLRVKSSFLNSLLDSSPDAMMTLDLEGRILSCNARTERLFGFTPGSLTGLSIERLLPSDYQLEDQDYEGLCRQLETRPQKYLRAERVGMRGDADTFPVEVTYARLGTEEPPRLLLIIREITEHKVAEEELDALRVQYFQQEKMAQIGLLMSGILHEVGNPLAAIEGLLEQGREALAEGLAGESQASKGQASEGRASEGRAPEGQAEEIAEWLSMALEQTARIRAICQEVSGFSASREAAWGPLDLNEILRAAVRLLQYDKRWQGVDWQLQLGHGLPAMEGTPDQLTQVLMNLLVNAGDAVRDAGIQAPRVTLRSGCLGGDRLWVEVQDNGCGMSEAVMARIFANFYTTKPQGRGTGLGLSICEKLVADHGGVIDVESREAEGTRVCLYFPALVQGDGHVREDKP